MKKAVLVFLAILWLYTWEIAVITACGLIIALVVVIPSHNQRYN
jgi:hypothetical protein